MIQSYGRTRTRKKNIDFQLEIRCFQFVSGVFELKQDSNFNNRIIGIYVHCTYKKNIFKSQY